MNLPAPPEEALQHSHLLLERIRDLISEDGWISFARFMQTALYEPGLGYYSGGSRKFGPGGDFITAPELTPLFGQALSRQLCQIMAASAPRVLECGAGTGLLAADILAELERLGTLPEEYLILELSGELRARQFDTLAQKLPHLASRVRWIDTLPPAFQGVVLANELLDVLPVHLLAWRAEGIFERGVTVGADSGLCWADRPAQGKVLAQAEALGIELPQSGEYVSELNLAARAWIASLADSLEKGGVLLIDYGYPRAEYYLPSRSSGTLLCYYRHHAHGEPLLWPGLNDITAFVDFTAIAEAGFEAGLEVLGYTNHAHFLFNCGLLEVLDRRGARESSDYIRAARAAQRLTTPQEMGELFKVLALGRHIPHSLLGFARGDRMHAL